MSEDFKKGFLKTLWILKEYLPVIIIGGGWAPLIYYHYLIKDKSKRSIRTRDIDLFVNINLPVFGNRTVDQLLLEAGLQFKFSSDDNPPVIHYEGDIEGDDIEIEFLTDKRGAKEAKDLYYIFDILANCDELEEGIIGGLKRLEKIYSKWFPRFLQNMDNSFSDLNADGVTMISNQRPVNAFPELNDAQFKQYVFGKFQKIIEEIKQ